MRVAACGLCLLWLLALYALLAFIQGGGYARLLGGDEPEPGSLLAAFAPGSRLSLAAAAVLGLLWILDVLAITVDEPRVKEKGSDDERKYRPFANPLDFALLRLRRYLLIPLVFGYAAIFFCFQPFLEPYPPPPDYACLIAFALLLADSRRPLNWTHASVIAYIGSMLAAAGEKLRR